MSNTIPHALGSISNFRYWCQKILPAVYDDSLSYYELLAKIYEKLNEIIEKENIDSEAINELNELYTQLQNEFELFKENGFYEYYEKQVMKWIDENLEYIYKYTIKQIYFGLNENGHLVAYIPESWEQIEFSTPMDYNNQDTYGRLVLSYNVEP